MIVTIDGPAGSGKSTLARALAQRLGFRFLDTGAMYRAVALACLRRGIELDDERAVAATARQVEIRLPGERVLLDGEDVTAAIRTKDVTHAASVVAVNAGVREALADLQRKLAAGENIVTEGRDQGTHVFPDAECKFYFTADPRERALRRQKELQEEGVPVPFEEMLEQIRRRDQRDETRPVAPLQPAEDAVHVDTTGLSPEEALEKLVSVVERRIAQSR